MKKKPEETEAQPSGAKARDEAAADAAGEEIVREQERQDAKAGDALVLMRAPMGTGNIGVTLDTGETLAVKADDAGCVKVPQRFVEKLLSHGFVGEPRR